MATTQSGSSANTNGHATQPTTFAVNASHHNTVQLSSSSIPPSLAPFFPQGSKSLSGISIRAFLLGLTMGICLNLTFLLVYLQHYLWRIPCFTAVLALFHYLEFDMTARYNTMDARISSFLLSNGSAYNIAHCMAIIECATRWSLQDRSFNLSFGVKIPAIFPTIPTSLSVVLGLMLIIIGQTTRSLAMRTAGRSFNHLVQSVKREHHVLVTDGVYGWSRHPSYFGFFWWGLGTQFLLGNHLCFAAYSAVLWKFFAARIMSEC